ncbi:phosphoribosylglycinamide formyltransferase [Anaeromusa sp.]|jgi:phosphoribosylglycinamide formyltransferase-1|uniref:phosphoribosylglycinamide formyltransferase n=1 Tax=Anaeromusa sp. TaxID=1872520 RepID=UPI00263985C3|nr:phosphoribosylglycinamide formyltransferase [Anaeromusa sp.]MDD3157193.1 phosphoribosylglycinamide formyltransferase [Anaeromusa sp.]MEA4835072.1 phosphoribosylglycinamide formyltransferase [Anaeromusa sp.]NCB75799.1 phosphoribosylglycinamide formyltransferase [Negativicutes bacterium]
MTAKKALGVLVSGRGSNLQAILDAIHAGRLPLAKVGVVISDNPEAKALLRVRGMGIPTVVLERKAFADRTAYETALADELERHQVDLVVLAGFMRILSACFIQRFPGAIVNIHPSLLPAFPGLDAQGQALRYGVKVAGCTVHFVDEGMDSGPIILQEAVPVELGDTTQTLADRILHVEHRLYPRAIALFCEERLEIEGRQVHIRSEK